MLKPSYTRQFENDLKRMWSRGKSIEKLKKIIGNLADEIPLDKKQRDHKLIGSYKGRRECHIEPNPAWPEPIRASALTQKTHEFSAIKNTNIIDKTLIGY